jgi:uncharacterized RDD family membrane protein YckC
MKCPKCGYLGFEHVDRCRNCGYDFSLTPSSIGVPELPIRHASREPTPLDDFSLIDRATVADGAPPLSDAGPDLERLMGIPSGSTPSAELPLFGPPIPDDQPLITKPSPPRQPLAVRRATPESTRPRKEPPRMPSLDLALDLDTPPMPASARSSRPLLTSVARPQHEGWPQADSNDGDTDDRAAPVAARAVAVAVDLLILAAIDMAVVYFTIQICGLSMADVNVLPKVPLTAFLLAQNIGYLVAFTAGGQTLGKMAAGIRVVPADSHATLDFGHACLRTLMWLVLAVPAGLGFLTAIASQDHRGLHDRFAGTRVVRASA